MLQKTLLICLLAMLGVTGKSQVADDVYADRSQKDTVTLNIVSPANLDKSTKKQRKAEQKRLRQRVDSLGHAKAGVALERGYWVILAERINVGRTGYTVNGLNGNSNFVFQQAQEGMVQFAFNHGRPGLNGMGGMTLEGKVGNVQLRTDKNGNVNYTYTLIGNDINAQVDVMVYHDSDYAQAVVTPTFSGPQITIYGRLVPYIRPRHQ